MDEPTTNPAESALPWTQNAIDSAKGLMRGEISEANLSLLIKAVTALALLIVAYFVAKLVSRWVASLVCKRVDMTLGKFAGKFVFYTMLAVIGLPVMQTVGVDVAGVAAILAAAGFAVGLAFQGTLSNFASGILLLVFRPFRVGDVVTAAGITGKVNEIDLFTTTFDTPDNRRLIVPNSSIAGTTIENVTFHKERRVDVMVGVSYTASLDDTREVLTSCCEMLSSKLVAGENRGYQILLSNLNSSSVDWTIRFWTKSSDYWAVKESLTAEVKRQLDANQIEIPFPQMQLHFSGAANQLTSQLSPGHQPLPIPKMKPPLSGNGVNNRVRPRVRGENILGENIDR